MGNTFRTVLALAPTLSRTEFFAVILNLLIFLTIYVTPTNCLPLEEIQLKIPALGRVSHIGSLYDARRDNFIGASIFKTNLPSHLISTTQTPRINTESQIITEDSDKFNIFGLDLDTAASIQTGIIQPEGAASVLNEDLTSSTGLSGIFLQTFQTADQTLSNFNDELKLYLNANDELHTHATHVVTGVSWGGSVAVKFSQLHKRTGVQIQSSNILKQEFWKLKRTSEVPRDEAASFKMHLTSDVSLQNVDPTTLREARAQINHVRDSIERINSGLGVPLKFILTPISTFKRYLNVTVVNSTEAHYVDTAILHKYLSIMNDIKRVRKELVKIQENSNCVSKEINTEMEELQNNFSNAVEILNIQFKTTLLQVKSGSLNNSALSQVLENYEGQDLNPKKVRGTLVLNQLELQKVDFCSKLNEDYPGIQYFGSAPNLISKIYQNQNKSTYVLFTKFKFKQNDRVSYEDNLNIFLNILYKPSNALFIVDCDFSYTQCGSINGTVIKQIRRGNYTFDDVRMEIKITEMENKTEVLQCNKESGITGALCVSTVEGKSPKLNTYTLINTNLDEPPIESQESKVVGGNTAKPNEFPFQVLFLNSGKVHCGGIILNQNFILTAAHCLSDQDGYKLDAEEYESLTIVAGDHDWQIDNGTEQKRQIQDIYIHEKYKHIFNVNDVAIVKLSRPLNWSPEVQPILLPDADYEARGKAVVSGWGTLGYKGRNPFLLQKVTVPIVDRTDCVKAYEEEQIFVSVKMLCAGDIVEGGVDACQGDSGGPLSVKLNNGSFMLIGVVSTGVGCGRAEYPGIYMQVSKYVGWIQDTLNNFDKCSLRKRCENNGICVDGTRSFSCICADRFAGKFCEHLNKCGYPGTCAPPISDAGNCHTCRHGFVKDLEDGTRCKYANENASLIISSWVDIRRILLDGLNTTKIIQQGDSFRGTTYNFRTNKIFWFSWSDKKIYSAPINSKFEKTSILHGSASVIFGLAVDWMHQHLYWVDYVKHQICVSNFNGTMKKFLFNDGLLYPTSIAVNPTNGWMYWTDTSMNHIERAGLDGSQREVILSANIKNPSSIVIDFVDSRLFWSQGKSPSSIWSCDFNGSDPKLIFTPNPSQFSTSLFWRIATFDKYIYMIETYSNSIHKLSKCNGEELEIIYKSDTNLRDINIFNEAIQPQGVNVCSVRIDHCSHFCFPVPFPGTGSVSKTTCACPDGLSLSADERNCV